MRIKKGDQVVMLGGKDRGKTGKVSIALPNKDKVIVGGINLIKKHVRARKQGQKGQIVSKERAVPVSSVALICKSCGKPTRIGYKMIGESKVRVCKKCGAET